MSHTYNIHTLLDNLETLFEKSAFGDKTSSDMLDFIGELTSMQAEFVTDTEEEEPVNNWRSWVLTTADSHVNGPRNDDYGDPISDFRTTAKFWEEYLQRIATRRGAISLKPHDVAAMMMLLKVSRISWSPEVDDHWVDAAGYSACGYDCVQRQDS